MRRLTVELVGGVMVTLESDDRGAELGGVVLHEPADAGYRQVTVLPTVDWTSTSTRPHSGEDVESVRGQ